MCIRDSTWYEMILSKTASFADENMLVHYDAASNLIVRACAPGKLCGQSETSDYLFTTVVIGAILIGIGSFVAIVVTSVMTVWRSRRASV